MKKYILFAIFFIIVSSLGYFVFVKKTNNQVAPNSNTQEISKSLKENRTYADLNGDGEKEYLVLGMPENESGSYLKSIIAYDTSDTEIASLPQEIPIKVPILELIKVHTLNTNDPREYFSFDFIAGPHQSETMFFGLIEDKILPVCFKEIPEGPYDCLFYSGNVGYLPIKDLDNDGYVELIEAVDEYPGEGELSAEEETAIDKASEEQGVTDFTEGMKRIALREKGGRGRMVVWAIYSFNGKGFIEQTGNNYEKYYALIGNMIENKMRRSELSNDSLEYIQLVKDFWGHNAN